MQQTNLFPSTQTRKPFQFKPDTFAKARLRVDQLEAGRGFEETKRYLENKLNRATGAERVVIHHAYKYLKGEVA